MKNIRFIFVGALLRLLATGSAWAAKPRVQYDHKKMNIHLNLSMRAFTLYERMMPDDLRQEGIITRICGSPSPPARRFSTRKRRPG